MSTIGDRIRLLMHFKKLNATQLADILQVQRSSISHILTGRNKPSLDFVQKVINEFPEVSYDWLINGAGNLSKPSSITKDNSDTHVTNDVVNGVTVVTSESTNPDTPVTLSVDPKINKATPKQVTTPNTQEKSVLPRITKVIIFYEDGSYQEVQHQQTT